MSFHLHRRYLRLYIRRGGHILEAGAGAARFTIEFARLGANVTVGATSYPDSLSSTARGCQAPDASSASSPGCPWALQTSRFSEGSFEGVVCYGGLLSYVFDRADDALAEMLRITRPGGQVLFSVMSLAAETSRFLGGELPLRPE